MTKILLVDDDAALLYELEALLREHCYDVVTVKSAKDALALLKNTLDIRAVILDVKMPEMDGLTCCQHIRQFSQVPILMLTSAKEEIDRVVGLEAGADDYLPKPFSPRELIARIKALLRRSQLHVTSMATQYRFCGWALHTGNQSLTDPNGVDMGITTGLYNLLLCFVERPNRVLTREILMDLTQGKSLESFDRTIDVHIARLRKMLEQDTKHPTLIKTVRASGYLFSAKVDAS